MYSYNFDEVHARRGWGSIKWDSFHKKLPKTLTRSIDDLIPLWVADMDFKAPEVLIEEMQKLSTHGIYGYHAIPKEHGELVKHWLEEIHEWDIDADKVGYSNGVVTSIIANILACSSVGDEILYISPIYGPIHSAIKDFGRVPVPLVADMDGEEFRVNFADFKAKINSNTRLFILCNPHNPGGKVWSKEELEHFARICIDHGILIISNDIHSDLVYSDASYIAIAQLSREVAENTVTHLSISKTFNLGGQKLSHYYSDNDSLLKKISERNHAILGSMPYTCFGIECLRVLYTQGFEWYRALLTYLEANRNLAFDFISTHADKIRPIKPQGTYLMWLDCRNISRKEDVLVDFFVNKAGIVLNEGSYFGLEGEGFMRLNFACAQSVLGEALHRVENACNTL